MKKHYYFVSGVIYSDISHKERLEYSGSFELVQGETRENKFPIEVSDEQFLLEVPSKLEELLKEKILQNEQFFLEVPSKLEELLKEKFLQKYQGAKIRGIHLHAISRLN